MEVEAEVEEVVAEEAEEEEGGIMAEEAIRHRIARVKVTDNKMEVIDTKGNCMEIHTKKGRGETMQK